MASERIHRTIPAAAGAALAITLCFMLPGFVAGAGCLDAALAFTCVAGSASAAAMPGHGLPLAAILFGAAGSSVVVAVAVAGAAHVLVSRSLRARSRSTVLHGFDVETVEGMEGAVVAGLVQPRIYCSDALSERLDGDELRAVLLHERHHQRTLAPLQLVALAGLNPLVGWSDAGRGWLDSQRARIEISADREVLRRGIGRGVLARAILKLAPSAQPFRPGFATAADLRLRALLCEEGANTTGRPAVLIAAAAFVGACTALGIF